MRRILLSLAVVCCSAQSADDPRQLATDLGCYNCHGEPPRRNVPSFRDIAARYAKEHAREQELVDQLQHGSLFGHVAAHERLDDAQARTLVRWLAAGAP